MYNCSSNTEKKTSNTKEVMNIPTIQLLMNVRVKQTVQLKWSSVCVHKQAYVHCEYSYQFNLVTLQVNISKNDIHFG